MTVGDALAEATAELARAGCPSPRVDAEWLLADALGSSRSELQVSGRREVAEAALRGFRSAVERRAQREPLAYVLGEWGFRRLRLAVDRRVLVPRPETEVLVERCLALLRDLAEPWVLDIGVGSGAIALAIADEHPGSRVVATDSSPDALAVAEENRRRANLNGRVLLVEGELFADLDEPFDLVVSNPPYVDADELETLEPELGYEPRAALVAPGTTEAIVSGAAPLLRPGGCLALEVAEQKAGDVAAQLGAAGYREVTITRDLAGRERVVDGRTAR